MSAPTAPATPPAGPVPSEVWLTVGGREMPLLPVYVGREPGPDGSPLHTWVLYVHPDVEGDVVLTQQPLLHIDVLPAQSSVRLLMGTLPDGRRVAVKHAG